ncbi:GyrI-like domain-containing protein [Algoriphagus sp.]|uniref:GyrI-like domain-containing protein n=1 Tax=Algoriphagus sp. TaxID=1872435 RepID=UPI0025EABC21|nr:GyrI-like domain-containing protein [Algoriphagus sp.]
MEILITEIPTKILKGRTIETSFARQETSKLWKAFRASITQSKKLNPTKFYSIQRYGSELKEGVLNLDTVFEKCAAIDCDLEKIPSDFEEVVLEGGIYAVFEHQGSPLDFQNSLHNFIQKWLPKSGYELDARNHFETFDDKYDPFSENSVELVWIPIIKT